MDLGATDRMGQAVFCLRKYLRCRRRVGPSIRSRESPEIWQTLHLKTKSCTMMLRAKTAMLIIIKILINRC
jgi:hypothetical protein